MRCCQGAARAVIQSCVAFGSSAPDPLVGGGAGDSRFVGDVGDGPARADALDEETSAVVRHPGIGVGREYLFGPQPSRRSDEEGVGLAQAGHVHAGLP